MSSVHHHSSVVRTLAWPGASKTVTSPSTPNGRVTLARTVRFKVPVKARYLKLVVQSEVQGQPFACIAELDVLTNESL